MSDLQPRHAWCVSKISFNFSQHDILPATAKSAVQGSSAIFDALFEADNEISKVFVYADEGSLKVTTNGATEDLLKTGACYFLRLRKDRPVNPDQVGILEILKIILTNYYVDWKTAPTSCLVSWALPPYQVWSRYSQMSTSRS